MQEVHRPDGTGEQSNKNCASAVVAVVAAGVQTQSYKQLQPKKRLHGKP